MFFRRNDTVSRQIQRRVVLLGLSSFLGFTLALVLSVRFNLQQLDSELNDSAWAAARSIDQMLGEVQRDLRTTAASLNTAGEASGVTREVLRLALERQEATFTYTILALDGKVITQRRRIYQTPDQQILEQPWLRDLRRGLSYVGPVKLQQQLPFLMMAAPILDQEGALRASLVAKVDLSSLWRNINSRQVGESGKVMITDDQGHILVHRDLTKVRDGATLPQLLGWSPGALSRQGTAFCHGEGGAPVVAAAMQLQFAPWYAVVEQPRREALAPMLLQGVLLFVPILLLAFLVYGIFYFTRQRIVLPLMRLRRGVESLGRGQLDHRIEVVEEDELGALAGAFNHLAAQLRTTIDRLHRRVDELKATQRALSEARDTLERRVRERTADLETANEEMRSLVYLVSHDLRSPLINLKGFTGELHATTEEMRALVGEVVDRLPEERRQRVEAFLHQEIPECLEFIDSATSRMDSVTIALLRLSRTGHRPMSPTRVNTSTMVHEILGSLRFEIVQKEVQVTLSELPDVFADRLALEQIFGNLLTNAIHYLRPDTPGKVEVWGEMESAHTTYHVRDNGQGIATENLTRVFEPFRRLDRDGTPGEGMGLAYTQALVRRHRGRIWCDSRRGEGSEFIFTISHHLDSKDGGD